MKISQLGTKTQKNSSESDISRNAQLLTRAGFVHKLMAGVYSFLPLGMRVLNKIENIVRDEMNKIDGREILMPALHPREIWDQTDRWDKMDILYKLVGAGDRDLALGPTHEEVVTPLMAQQIQSYRDLPVAVYQIQTKFRNEARAKSGLLRGREFRMKDLYSFHATQEDLDRYYERAVQAYHNVFRRCGLGDMTLLTYASGGAFSKYSHEFQTITPYGEDTIYRVPGTDVAINKEILDDKEVLRELIPNYKDGDEKNLEEVKAIEVGNIFKLGTRFSESFSANFTPAEGAPRPVIMGCYGIGPSRLMGTVAECLSDERGLIWPREIAPFQVHIVSLLRGEEEGVAATALYEKFKAQGIDVLLDDRPNAQAGEKLADADLMGIPHRVVISKKTLAENGVEYKARADKESRIVPMDNIFDLVK